MLIDNTLLCSRVTVGRRAVLTVTMWQCLSKYSLVDTCIFLAFTLFLTLYLDGITKHAFFLLSSSSDCQCATVKMLRTSLGETNDECNILYIFLVYLSSQKGFNSGVWVMLQESKPAEKGGKAGNSKKETTAAESAQSGIYHDHV